MAKTFGILANATTGFTSVGTITSYEEETTADVTYGHDATGAPDSDNGGVLKEKTIKCELEVSGTFPAAKSEITIGSTVYIITKATQTWESEGVTKGTIEATEQKTA